MNTIRFSLLAAMLLAVNCIYGQLPADWSKLVFGSSGSTSGYSDITTDKQGNIFV